MELPFLISSNWGYLFYYEKSKRKLKTKNGKLKTKSEKLKAKWNNNVDNFIWLKIWRKKNNSNNNNSNNSYALKYKNFECKIRIE